MERSVLVRVRANLAELKREMASGAAAVRGVGQAAKQTEVTASTALGRLTQSARIHEQQWKTAGTALTAFGALTVGALALTAKAAIDWENAWTGVTKTVEGTPQQLQDVEDGLRDLARELPATHGEIAAVAEAAGQLGIATPDVVRFTKVMVDLGETTNLTAEEAATSIAQLMNIMQTAPDQVGNLGSALVALGNDGASTERQIIQMAQRIAGAGRIIGLTEAEVLGFANALASVGIEVDAGGSAISRVMSDIAKAVSAGGSELDGFAQVAGVSAQEFARAFREDPAQAITLFVEGLDRINRSGGDVFGTLDELGQSDIRVSRALLSMAGAGDLLRNSLDLGARAWEENTALIEEAEKRYDTTAAKIAIAKNNIVDTAITLGEMFLPAISAVAEVVADFAQFIGGLPGPVQAALVGVSGLAGAAALAAGGFLLLVPRVLDSIQAFRTLRTDLPRVASGLRALGIAGAVVGGILALDAAMDRLVGTSKEVQVGAGEATRELLGLREGISSDLVDRVVEANRLLEETPDLFGKLSLGFGTSSVEIRRAGNDLEKGLTAIDQGLSSLVASGTASEANALFREVAQAWEEGGGSVDELRDKLPLYRDELARVDVEQQRAAESVDPLQDKLAELGARFGLTGEDAAEAAQEMVDEWRDAAAGFVDVLTAYQDALAAKEEVERKSAEAAAEAAGKSAAEWEQFASDVTITIDDFIAELDRQIAAQANWAENMALLTAMGVDEMLFDHLARLGPEGAGLVQTLVDGGEEKLEEAGQKWRDATGTGVTSILERLAEGKPALEQIARDEGQAVADSIALGMAQNGTTVKQEAKRQGINIDEGVGLERDVDIDVQLPTGLRTAEEAINVVARNRTTTIRVGYAITGSGLPRGVTGGLADGGILNFAEGGEHHTAQIAPAGAWRVWAEPETGGEAYIPLGEGKRSRSLSILGDVADRFGYNLIRANAMRFADGGVVPAGSASRAVAGHATVNNFQLDSAAAAATARGYANEVNVRQRRDDAVRGRYPVGG